MPKKGKKSVGVARQWCGRLGKVDNCQTGVYASLVHSTSATIIDCRLYLPKEWTGDRHRCKAAGVPKDVTFKTKSQLALDIVHHARSNGLRYAWVGVDGGYGKEPLLLKAFYDEGEQFVADVHKYQSFYLEDPCPYNPDRHSAKGRTPSRYKTESTRMVVEQWAASQPEGAWQRISPATPPKDGWRWISSPSESGFGLTKNSPSASGILWSGERLMPKKLKDSLSNAPAETITERLASMQGQRYFVELKQQPGWIITRFEAGVPGTHHMAMVMMSMLFLLKTRREQDETHPLLSCPGIVGLLAYFFPRRDITPEEVLRQMEVRHRQRKASIDSAYRRQAADG